MATMQTVIDLARIPLNDNGKVRYLDTVLLGYANSGIKLLRQKRPDIFFGKYGTPVTDLALSDAFPIDDDYRQPIADYVTARAHSTEDEASLVAKAQSFFSLFKEQLS